MHYLDFRSVNVIQNDHSFESFIQFHYKNLDISKIKSIPCDKFKYFPNVLFYSKDLDDNNLFSESVRSEYDMSKVKEPDELNSFIKFVKDSQITYVCISKAFHFDKLEYKEVFYSLQTLHNYLKKNDYSGNLYIHDVTINNKNIKKDMFGEIIYYILKDTPDVIPIILDTERITPKSREEISKILQENHDSKLAGHSGFLRTYKRIKEFYKWDTMKKDIKKYVKRCPSCQVNKTNFRPSKAPMEITSTSNKPFERLALDIVGPLPQTLNDNRFILTMQDDLTKFSYAVPIQNHEAQTVATELSKFITLFGIPKTILTDQGTDFTSRLMKDLTKLFDTKHLLSSPYHPQTNGALERSHLTLKDYLKHYINGKQTDCDEFIIFAMMAYNTHVHKSTGFTPYETLFGSKAYLPTSIIREPTLNYSYDDYIINLKQKLNYTQKIARDNLIQSKTNSNTYYDNKIVSHTYKVDDLVYILNKQNTPGLNKKLTPNYKGPYKITKVNSNNTVQIQKNRKLITYHTNLLKPSVSGDQDE